jgi:hypothetical protein
MMECVECGGRNVSSSMETEKILVLIGDKTHETEAKVEVFHCRDCETLFTGELAEIARDEAVKHLRKQHSETGNVP